MRRLGATVAAYAARVEAFCQRHHLLTVVVVATLIATPGFYRLEQLLDDIVDARNEARVVSCRDSKEVAEAINRTIVLAYNPPGRERTPEQQKFVDLYVPTILLPVRSCSDRAISDHFQNQGGP